MEITPVEEFKMIFASLNPYLDYYIESVVGTKIIEEYTPTPGASISLRYVKGLRLCDLSKGKGLWWLDKPYCGLRIAYHEECPEVENELWRVSFDETKESTPETILSLGGETRTILQSLKRCVKVCGEKLSKGLEGCENIIAACEVLEEKLL